MYFNPLSLHGALPVDHGRGLPGTRVAHRLREGCPGVLHGHARPDVDGPMSGAADFGTIRYETSADKVATITLDRPEVMNAFDRQMCHEVREAWRLVKDRSEERRVGKEGMSTCRTRW